MKKTKNLLTLCISLLTTGMVLSGCGNNQQSSDEPSSQVTSDDSTSMTDPSTETTDTGDSSSSGEEEKLPTKLKILYQGDSITDSSRDWDEPRDLGNGYARMVSEQLEEIYGDQIELEFVNNAHWGWRLMDNWNEGGVNHYQEQFYQFNADIATILIGFNDIMASKSDGPEKYVSDEAYENAYDELLAGLKERGTYAVCLSPYYIVDNVDDADYYVTEFNNKRAIVQKLAEKYDFGYVNMKPCMDAALAAGADKVELFGDLIHPSYAGNKIIEDLVLDAIRDHIDPDYTPKANAGEYVPITGHNDNPNDLTNKKVYCYSALGPVAYDDTVYCDRDDFDSSESLKITNYVDYNGDVCTHASILPDTTGVDLYGKQIEFDMKIDNCVPEISMFVQSSFRSKSSDRSTEYIFQFTNDKIVASLGNGWFHAKVNVEDWMKASTSNEAILKNCRQLIIGNNRGYNFSREANHIDSSKPSNLWIDNLEIKEAEEAPTMETATKSNNWELMSLDEGWGNGTVGEYTTTETYGSLKARKFTFENSLGYYKNELNEDGSECVYFSFSPESEWGTETGIDIKDKIISFDFKLSDEFYESNYNCLHMCTLTLIDSTWNGPSMWIDLTTQGKWNFGPEYADNGWLHCEVNLKQRAIDDTNVTQAFNNLNGDLIRLRFGFWGLTPTTKKTASIVIDNLHVTPVSY